MKKTINKISVVFGVIAIGVLLSSFAVGADKVSGGKHDFSFNGTAANNLATDGTLGNQTCIYCHTPHNAGQTRLLWNKAGNGNTTFKLYTSSPTLSNVVKTTSALTADSPSLICLSCHDGKTAMNVLHSGGQGILASTAGLSGYPADSRLAFGAAPQVLPEFVFGDPGPAVGGPATELTNDHPIGFSYPDAQTEKTATNLHATIDARIKLFGPTQKVECSTCHNPHADSNDATLVPFLVMSNANSALCLACHNK